MDELVAFIRAAVPKSNEISKLEANQKISAVIFTWFGTEFVVKPTLNVLELRGTQLYVSGLSILMETVLKQKKQLLKEAERRQEEAQKK